MKRNRLYGFGAAITAALLCAVLSAQAAVPAVINYQSRLRTAGGVAIKTATNVSFSLYSAAMGGSKLWTESYSQSSGACTKVMPDANGYFSVQMGSCEAFPSTITFTTPLFLGVTIENDAEATPRVAFAPAPYAMNAVRVGNFVSDISAGTLTGEPLGTATLDTQGFHSAGLLLQGSGWDGSVAANTGFKVRTTATDASNYRLSFLNTTDGSESVSILNNGRVGIGIANPQSELEVAGIIYADDFRTRGGTISTTGDGTNDVIRFTRPKLFIGHTASVTTVSPVTNLIELKEDAVTFLQDTYFGKLVSIPSRQIKLGDNIFTFPIAAPGANDLVLTTDTEGELSWTPKSSGGGSGSVTSVELSAPSTEFLVAGSPVTDSGTLSLAWKAQQPNDILAGPASGAAADVPTFRKLDPLDIPDLTAAKITSGTLGIDLIPNLSADKITSGTLGIDRIPDIPSAKVTGVLDDTNIPVLDIAIKTSGTLAVTRGGTGLATTAQGDLIFSDAINSLARLTIGTTGKVLTVSSVGLPIWSDPTTSGTVTSVGLTAPSSILTVSGSPVTGSGDLALDLAPQSARKVFIGPLTGTEKPTFRDLTSDDIPDLSAAKITSGTLGIDRIPDIPSARVTGTLGVAQIPDLSADKITTGTLSADRIPVLDIATKTSGTLAVTRGGTGLATTAQGDILFSDAINSLATLRIGADGQILTVNSAGLPVWLPAPATGVTSVGLKLPSSLFAVTGSPVTSSGTISTSLADQDANMVFAGPVLNGTLPEAPTFRKLDPIDIPALDAGKITSGVFAAARIPAVSSSSIPDLDADKITSGVFNIARIPNIPAANITGVLATSSIPSLDASKVTSGTFGVAQGGTGLSTVGAAGTVLTSVGGTPQWSPVPAGLSGSGAFGQLAFWNASSTLAGNSKIIIDDTNSRLAIGTTASPATTLVVAGDTTVGGDVVPSTASAYDFGSTTKPVRSVYSDNLGSATQRIKAAYIDELYIYGGAGGSGTSTISATQTVFNGIAYNWPNGGLSNNFVLTTDANGNLGWQNPTNLVPESGWRSLAGNIRLGVITDKVGIGTATPAEKLDVVGNIQASGFLSSGTGQIKLGGATYSFPTSLPSSGQILTASSTPGNLQFRSLAATDIPALDASKITTGIFSAARIPAVASSSIPDLDTSKITTGIFNIARIPNIPAANVTGVLGTAQGGTGLSAVGAAGTVLTSVGGAPQWTAVPAGLGGSGVAGKIALFNATGTITSSALSQTATEINTSMNTRLSGTVWLGENAASGAQVGIYAPTKITSSLSVNGPSFLRGDVNIGMPNGPEAGVGVLRINNGSLVIPFGAGAGKVLTSDNAGNASWQAAAAGGVSGSGAVNAIPLFSNSSTVSNSVLSQVPGTTPYVVPGTFSVLTGAATTVNATSNIAIAGNLYVGAVGGINDIVGLTRFGRDISTTSGNITATNGQVVGNNGITAGVSINALGSSVSIGSSGVPFASLFTKALSLSTGAGAGKVLTSDNAGNATWQTPTTNNDIQRPGTANLSVGASMPSGVGGQFNVALGGATLRSLTGGSANTGLGSTALELNTTGSENTAIGTTALRSNIIGSRNTAVGRNAGFAVTGSSNTLIGTGADASGAISNSIAIGEAASATKSNQVVLGNSSITETLLRGSVIAGGNLLPEGDNVYDLGSPTKRWRDIYVGPATIKVVGSNGQIIESIGAGSGSNVGKLVVKALDGSERQIGGSSAGIPASVPAGTTLLSPIGSAGAPAFRTLTALDIPSLDVSKITTGALPVTNGGTGLSSVGSNGQVLTVVNGLPAWQAPAAGGSSGIQNGQSASLSGLSVSGSTSLRDVSVGIASGTSKLTLNGTIGTEGQVVGTDASGVTKWITLPSGGTSGGSGSVSFPALVNTQNSNAQNPMFLASSASGVKSWQDMPWRLSSSNPNCYSNCYRVLNAPGFRIRIGDYSNSPAYIQDDSFQVGMGFSVNDFGRVNLTGSMNGSPSINFKTVNNESLIVEQSQSAATAGQLHVKIGGASTPALAVSSAGISVSGTVKANGVTLTSDGRLKENITKLNPVLTKLDVINGVNFTWKDGKVKGKQLGVIAQDVEKSFPELVDTDSVTGMKSVNYSGLAAVAIQGVKELDAKVEAALPVTGEGVIRAGESEVLIFTSQVSTGAKIFVTPVGSTGGQTLYVDTVVGGEYFTVKTDRAVRSPARFNWMIIK